MEQRSRRSAARQGSRSRRTTDGEASTVSGDLLATDVDNAPDAWQAASGSTAHGSWTVSASGVWVFTLDNTNAQVQALNASSTPLTDTFTVQTADGTSQVVSITINGANEPVTVVTKLGVETGTGDSNDNDNAGPAAAATAYTSVDGQNNGSNTINGSNLSDLVYAGSGNDTVYGHNGNDTIYGQVAADSGLYGQGGDDSITGGQGADTIYGGSGNDTIFGYEGPDNTTNNTSSNDGADSLYGGSGSDTIYGQTSDDNIVGGFGMDVLWGNGGADSFRFIDVRDRGDLIRDFNIAEGDILNVLAIDANSTNAVGTNDTFAWGGTTATANGLWYAYNAVTNVTTLYGDTDGNVATAEFWVDLTGNVDLQAAYTANQIVL